MTRLSSSSSSKEPHTLPVIIHLLLLIITLYYLLHNIIFIKKEIAHIAITKHMLAVKRNVKFIIQIALNKIMCIHGFWIFHKIIT